MIYQPAEDSFLMSEILKEKLPKLLSKNPRLKFLEIGAGSGIHLETAEILGVKNIFSSDIDKKSVSYCNLLGFNCIQSDLFEKIPKQKFDLIIFNPPYLPEDSREPKNSRLATTGGKKGNEIILRFLQQAKNYLEQGGKIFLITSSLAEDVNFEKLGYNAKEVGCEKLFFERLCIWEITTF
ncbi:Release factor glutamine methyltransferase [uncultured archaeon]|nr:Release factor glutamine methyltransferase [uncultured archaeon]